MSDEVSNKSIPGPIEVTDEVRSSIPGDEIPIGLHKAIVIITSQVLYANAHPSVSHMSANFTAIFGESIRMTRYVRIIQTCSPFIISQHSTPLSYVCRIREVVRTTTAQPFLISGSGTLGWDQASLHFPPSSLSRPPKIQMLGFSQPRRAWRKRFGAQRGIFRR
jgi:hypothetical protein